MRLFSRLAAFSPPPSWPAPRSPLSRRTSPSPRRASFARRRRGHQTGTAGEAITAGQPVYKKSADSKWYKADCNSATAEVRVASAISLTGSAAGQPVVVQKGGSLTIGGHHHGQRRRLLPLGHGRRHPPGRRQHDRRLPADHRHGTSATVLKLSFALRTGTAL
jgi:hypothetical protein